jgi:hypothetical protein
MTTVRPRVRRRQDPRWLLLGLAVATAAFLAAYSRHPDSPPPSELPQPPARIAPLGRLQPTSATFHVGEYFQVDLHPSPGQRYGVVESAPSGAPELLQQVSPSTAPPQFRAITPGTVLVTVLLEPDCPAEGICRSYRRNLGAVRVQVVP